MQISLHPFKLNFKFPFRIAHGVRTGTDVVYVKLEHEGYSAWGEAALPPYLPETQKSVSEFLTAFSREVSSDSIDDWMGKLKQVETDMSAKAALDMALWNLKSQLENKTMGEILGIKAKDLPPGTYTIGACLFDEMKLKVDEADKLGFEIFKIKLTGEGDEELIVNFRKLSAKPFAVDINEGWPGAGIAVEKINWLKKQGCLFIEQPLHKDALREMMWLKERSSLPCYADESCQRLKDLELVKDCFDGINIKLMKCGGITEARQMIYRARELGMKILIGCMSESTIGCSAAAHLTPLADFADLDGPYLIDNDAFASNTPLL